MNGKQSAFIFLMLSLFQGHNAGESVLEFGPCKMVLRRRCPDENIKFFLFTKDQPEHPEPVKIGSTLAASNLSDTRFDEKKPTKLIIHGYSTDMNVPSLVAVRNEYLKTHDYNIFAVDWSALGKSPCYPVALLNLPHIGNCTAQLVQRLRDLNITDIHVIGFSLGAHVTNYLSVALRPYRLPRITGLDPALPGFILGDADSRLDKTDADFVDVIHTNAFMKGKVAETGTVDLYMNGGIAQPGCPATSLSDFTSCNHNRAPYYFAESINTEVGFYGWPCPSYADFLSGKCPPREPQILMGEYVNRTARGVYLVKTASSSPYALGKMNTTNKKIARQYEEDRTITLTDYLKQINE